ncbi:enoyl-CoA hydratase/isomerase family protein [Falsihalocynthiibacter arcticus]|uniref:Enoyl-CoA hydratase n=1 Tax=Falsihalocynthiibacter arcticus TaxID=1579316 RepID=A0A126V1J9_9RHOB|nr:enoyl-CoA hydratase/isomerase family protein [Falsihalocynthiibacter arcticus]AML52201.1 enoyl-CoA hydratase [Falsihalocynthiibacter arcticus]
MSNVHLDLTDGVAELRLDNPTKLNALTPAMLADLERHLTVLETNADLRCVVLTAQGDRAFCVGADINAWADLSPMDFARYWIRSGHRIFDRIARLHVPTIAVLSGHAFGGGLELAAACDLRVASPRATLALPETGVGIVPGWSGTQRLVQLMPAAILKELVLTGRRLSAERAYTLGFVNSVSDDPRGDAFAMAAEIKTKSPQATEVAKYMLAAALNEERSAMIEALGGAVMAASPDKTEGVAAFRAKRPANFKDNSRDDT